MVRIDVDASDAEELTAVLLGIAQPAEGTVLIDGLPFAVIPERARPLFFRHLGIVSTLVPLIGTRTVTEEIRIPLEFQGWNEDRIGPAVSVIIRKMDLTGVAEMPINQLSACACARTALARALVAEPLVLMLDAPLANMTTEGRSIACAALSSAHTAGASMLMLARAGSSIELSFTEHFTLEGGTLSPIGATPTRKLRSVRATRNPLSEEQPAALMDDAPLLPIPLPMRARLRPKVRITAIR
jgi:ABC-type ATPase involved in cell division